MKKFLKIFVLILAVIIILAGIYFGNHAWHIANIGAAYKAKILCSSVFISNRNPEDVLSEDLSDPRLNIIKVKIDYERKQVIATAFLGIVKRVGAFRQGLGGTLDLGEADQKIAIEKKAPPETYSLNPWPEGNVVDLNNLPSEIDRDNLNAAVDYAFAEPDPAHLRRTRAVVVVYQGRIIAERYADGFTKDTPLLGWSMTKSVINALAGILVGQGKLSLDAPTPISEWQHPDDPRRAITLDDLLRMSSGLEFSDRYSDLFSDAIVMLFREKDCAGFAIDKPLIADPGTKWTYSSGTTNIISKIMRQTYAGNERQYLEFPQHALFHRIGMYSAVMEPDAAGTFVGSSHMYATARDWARFGLLYLQDGIWDGERILPEGWVQYTTTPTETAPHGKFGAHWWLNPRSVPIYNEKLAADLPSDLFTARGHHDQFVTIIPSKNLVVVRLGLTLTNNTWNQAEFLTKILAAIL
ncbi:MAG: serine hydrolase [bacterium]|nr:serine hydrolase [bacterium]